MLFPLDHDNILLKHPNQELGKAVVQRMPIIALELSKLIKSNLNVAGVSEILQMGS